MEKYLYMKIYDKKYTAKKIHDASPGWAEYFDKGAYSDYMYTKNCKTNATKK